MSVAQPSPPQSAKALAEPKTWAERLWLKNRQRMWWQLPILAAIDGWLVFSLYVAATRGITFGGPRGHRAWFSIHDHPAAFWTNVLMNAITLAMGVGVPCWVAYSLRHQRHPPLDRK